MVRKLSRKLVLSAAAAATVIGAASPAFAGGGRHGHVTYYSGHHYNGHHSRHYRHHRHHGGGGKAAAIALGVIGGAIILDSIAEQRARDRYYEDRYYDARARARYPAPAYPVYDDDRYADYDPGPSDGNLSDDDIDGRLAGRDGGPAPIRYSAEGAFNACIVHARAALSERGFQLAGPSEPETAEDIGGAWKMTANVTTSRGADMWTRAMYCEADEGRVYVLELL